ncbi:hypothetical protein N9Y42_06700 [Mariniblastus sp.]|nr:hypothetical protein [Mariniblastus sp.]
MSEQNAWVLRPFPDGRDKYQEFLDSDYISVGWPNISDFATLQLDSRDDIKAVITETYGEMSAQSLGQYAGILNRYINEIRIGDLILVPYYGEVSFARIDSDCYYQTTDPAARHRRNVTWISKSLVRTSLSEEFFTALKGRQTVYTAYLEPRTITQTLQGKFKGTTNDSDDVISGLVIKFIKGIENKTQKGVNQVSLEKELVPAILEKGMKVGRMGTTATKGEGDVDLILPVLPDLEIYLQVKYWQDVNAQELESAKQQIRAAMTEHQTRNENTKIIPVVFIAGKLADPTISSGWHDGNISTEQAVLVLTISEMDAWIVEWISSLNPNQMSNWGLINSED